MATAFLVLYYGVLLGNHLGSHKRNTKITPIAPMHSPSAHKNASIFERPVRTPAFGELCFNPPPYDNDCAINLFYSIFSTPLSTFALFPARSPYSRRNLDPGSQNIHHPKKKATYIYFFAWVHLFKLPVCVWSPLDRRKCPSA